jgi:hypothetical protein
MASGRTLGHPIRPEGEEHLGAYKKDDLEGLVIPQ